MSTQQWLAAFVALFFVFGLQITLSLNSINRSMWSIEAKAYTPINVRILNQGLDITNHPEFKWTLEHQNP